MILRFRTTVARLSILLAALVGAHSIAHAQSLGPWPQWRGPRGDNHAAENASLPRTWDMKTGEGIRWKTPIAGRGHSTPIITPAGIFLTTAETDRETQSVVKIDLESGRELDKVDLHQGTLPKEIHGNNSHASPSMAFDGENLFALFYTNDSLMLTSLNTDLQQQWQIRVCEFKPKMFQFGYGASPIVEGDLVIVAGEYDGKESGIYALDRRTGKQRWSIPRPANLNFASPIIAEIAGMRQMLIAGADLFQSFDPQTGKQRWSVDSTTEAICGTVVWDGRSVMVSGGNPASGTWCVSADGRARELWSNSVMCYEQSLLATKNYVFGIADSGVAHCWKTVDGKEMWKKRLFSEGVSASPLLVDGRIVVATEWGWVYQIAASPDRFEVISKNETGDSIFATPIVVGETLYVRTGVREGEKRQEYLVAIGR